MLSAGASFAADADDLIAADDEIAIDEALAIDDESIVSANTNVVTNDTFYNYFDVSGELLSNVTSDELTFNGEISGVGVDSIVVNRPIKLIGEDSTISNITFNVIADDVVISGFTINQSNAGTAFTVFDSDNVQIENTVINFNAVDDEDSYAIYALESDGLKLINNEINYVGTTAGSTINNGILISESNNVEIRGNKFKLNLVSCYVPWFEIPTGTGNWVSFPVSEGVVVDSSDNVAFEDNEVNVTYSDICGSYDTIYAVDFKNSNNASIINNVIDAAGHTYIYGIIISGDDFIIAENDISTVSDVYYANGIDVEGPAIGEISDNVISAVGVESSYPIYSGMNGQPVSVNYTYNNISGEAYFVLGMSLGDVESNILYNNIDLKGNYTTGIASRVSKLTAKYNVINLVSSEVGNESVWESFGVDTTGIKVVSGNANLAYNRITGPGTGIYVSGKSMGVSRNVIRLTANADVDAYAIHVDSVSKLSMLKNNVKYVGATQGNAINNGVLISSAKKATVSGNTFKCDLVSCYVPWFEIPTGSGNWVSFPVSEGVVVDSSDDILFDSNIINVKYIDVCGSYDTIYAVDFKSSANATIINNDIDAAGHTYIYGIIISCDDFTISGNDISTVSDVYYANGIDVEGPATGEISDNVISAVGVESSYPIYSGMNGQPVTVDYNNNNISGEAYFVLGMSLGDVESNILYNNIDLKGNYTTGIASRVNKLTAKYNVINLDSSEVGNESVWESFGVDTTGIKVVSGNANLAYNRIIGPGTGIYVSGKSMGVSRNVIRLTANADVDAYAIHVDSVSKLSMLKNNVKYVGATQGNAINNGVLISSAKKATVSGNTFKCDLVSCYVPWFEIPTGSGNWVSFPVSEGVVVDSSDDILFDSNIINVKYIDVCGSYDTIYAVDFKSSAYANIIGNDIDAAGHTYIYGIIISCNDFIIAENDISTVSDVYYANGIDVEGPATGEISDNNISAVGVESSYPIYSGMNGQPVSVNYTYNNISGEAYFVLGMSLGDVESNILYNNIDLKGNYTTGIASRVSKLTAKYNVINLDSSEVGNESVWESFGVDTTGIKVVSGNANLAYNRITSAGTGIYLSGKSMGVSRNVIRITGHKAKDAYAIHVDGVSKLSMLKNNVKFVGAKGDGLSNAILISNAKKATVSGNTFKCDLVSCYVPWAEVPAGSGNWVSSPISEGVVVDSSDDIIFDSNDVTVQYKGISGSYDTIYAVDFRNSANAVISNNKITANGHTYIYGIIISGDNFAIVGNDITTVSDVYYANGIDVEGPATGVVEDNNISVVGVESAYPIYSGMNGQDTYVNYTNNVISGEAYFVLGMSLGDVENMIAGNEIVLNGNYTTGIATRSDSSIIEGNTIKACGSNVGNESIWESFGVETIGIKITTGVASITLNDVESTAEYTIDLKDTSSDVEFNSLSAKTLTGDSSVLFTGDATVKDNT